MVFFYLFFVPLVLLIEPHDALLGRVLAAGSHRLSTRMDYKYDIPPSAALHAL